MKHLAFITPVKTQKELDQEQDTSAEARVEADPELKKCIRLYKDDINEESWEAYRRALGLPRNTKSFVIYIRKVREDQYDDDGNLIRKGDEL